MPACGGRLRLLTAITDKTTARRILEHLALPAAPTVARARSPDQDELSSWRAWTARCGSGRTTCPATGVGQKLVITALTMVDAVRAEPNASGAVTLWLPQRLDNPENRAAASDEEKAINDALAAADRRAASGRPIRVAFAFGGAPGR
jgi:hypothetical protein